MTQRKKKELKHISNSKNLLKVSRGKSSVSKKENESSDTEKKIIQT